MAVDDGRLESAYFEPSRFERLTTAVPNTDVVESGCAWRFERRIDRYPAPPSSLRKLVRSATTTALAVVEGVDSGFWLGHPSTLLRLKVRESAGPEGPTDETVLVYLMQGSVRTDEGLLCGNFSTRALPEPGDELRLLSARAVGWSSQEPSVLFPDEYYFVGPKAAVPPALYSRELHLEPEAYLESLLAAADALRGEGELR